MKNLKLLYSLLVVLIAGFVASCTTDTYMPASTPTGPQVSFSNENVTSIELTGEEGEASPTLILSRVNTNGALTVNILSEVNVESKDDDESENGGLGGLSRAEGESENGTETEEEIDYSTIFSIPSSVTFADGESTAKLVIEVIKPEALIEDQTYTVNAEIQNQNVQTPYGANKWSLDVKLFPWDLVQTIDVMKGKFRAGDAFSGYYDVESVLAEVDVAIYKHKTKEGMYLVYDPWLTVMVPTFGYESTEALLEDVTHTPAHFKINCTNPEKCYIEKQSMGIKIGSSALNIASDYHPETNADGIAGTFDEENQVLTWPQNGIIFSVGQTSVASNVNGAFRLILPGGEAVDYALAVQYKGMNVSADIKDVTTSFRFEHGADVTGVKYYFAEGNILANPTDAINALADGSAADIREVEGFNKGASVTEITTNIEKFGVYTIVAMPLDKNGNLAPKFVALSSFYYSWGDVDSHPCDLTIESGLYTNYVAEADREEETGDYNALGWNIKGKDIKALYVGAWTKSELDAYVSKNGKIDKAFFEGEGVKPFSIEDVAAINSDAGKNGACLDLEADSNYTLVVFAVNNYEKEQVWTKEHLTTTAPAYTGELKVGKYLWKYVSGKIEYKSVVDIQSYQGSSKRFLVSNIGYEDGSQWFAEYDAEEGTLSLDGTVRGRKKEGNLFGKYFGFTDEAKTITYVYVSKMEKGRVINDPLVFNINKESKEPVGIKNYQFAIQQYKVDSGETYGNPLCLYNNTEKTTIAPYVESDESTTPEEGNGSEGK